MPNMIKGVPKDRRIFALAVSMMLGGCWQADGSLYGKADPVTPFRAGAITETGGKQGEQHFSFALGKAGTYRMIGTDKGDGHGEGFDLRFFDLRGIPEDMMVYEAVSLTHCDRPAGCETVKSTDPRYYGLVRKTKSGAEEFRPDCKKDARVTTPFGIKAKDDVCTFATRGSLETSLLMLAHGDRKPDFTWRLK
ncbi:MAG: hypothetical protein V4559_00385 [Pseudomonadota bacterium]